VQKVGNKRGAYYIYNMPPLAHTQSPNGDSRHRGVRTELSQAQKIKFLDNFHLKMTVRGIEQLKTSPAS